MVMHMMMIKGFGYEILKRNRIEDLFYFFYGLLFT